MNSQTDEDLSLGDLHSCGKCKQTFTDVDMFFNHKSTHCQSNDDSIKLSECYSLMVSGECDQSQSGELETGEQHSMDNVLNFDTPASTSSQTPIVQTVLLARGLPPSSDHTTSSASDAKGQTVHFVMLPGHHCQHCLQIFSTESDLNEHSEMCTRRLTMDTEEDKNFLCALCSRSFKSATILKKHMTTHSDEKPFRCLYQGCTYSSRTKGSLVRHERRHTDSRPFKCEMCHRCFRESGALLRHKKSRMPCSEKRDEELPNYGRNLPLPGQPVNPPTDDDPLESHLLSTEFLIPEISSVKDSLLLGESSKDSGQLESKESGLLGSPSKGAELLGRHMKDSLLLEDRLIVQKGQQPIDVVAVHDTQHSMECGDNSSMAADDAVESTETARLTHHPISVSEYFTTCQTCESQCSSKEELKEHLRKHLTSGSFMCDQCSFIGSRQEFTAHITHIHSAPDAANSEFMASDWVDTSKSLDPIRTVSPQQAVREAIQIIQQLLIIDNSSADETLSQLKDKILTLKNIKNCPVCDKEFRSPSYLRHHIRVHTGERPYKCKLCPKDFPTKDTFKKHMHCHSDERSFKCGECGKLFKRITHAKEHLKIHSNDRPYTCSICKKSFKTATIFKVHERTHTVHMPWVCKVCQKRFREKASLTRHVRIHTGDKPYKCKYCGKEFAEHGTLSRHIRAKAPCSAALAEARRPLLKAYPSEEQLQTIVITEDGDIACPTVLTEFSAVVTDTQQYMSPQSQLNESIGTQSIDTAPLDAIEVNGGEGMDQGYHIIVNEGHELTYSVDQTTSEQQEPQGSSEDGCTSQSSATQYVYLDNLDEDAHSLTLHDQTSSDHVMLITNC